MVPKSAVTLYSSKLVLEKINYTRFTHIVLVLSQRTHTLQVKRKEIYSFAFRFKFLSLGLEAFPTRGVYK